MDDAPPAKRRRASPRLAGLRSTERDVNGLVAVAHDVHSKDSGGEDNGDLPSATPLDAIVPPQSPSRIPRPSFASPTRASLARHNPSILNRRMALSHDGDDGSNGGIDEGTDFETMIDVQLGQGSAEKETAAHAGPAPRNGVQEHERARPLAHPPQRSPSRSPHRSEISATRPLAQPPLRSPLRQTSLYISRSPSRSPTRRLFAAGSGSGNLLGELPRRSPMKPIPRPLPPPNPQRSEDILEPLIARDRRLRAGLDLFRVRDEQLLPEPELPPTPEHPDPALTASPPGLQNYGSTPSKKQKRKIWVRSAEDKANGTNGNNGTNGSNGTNDFNGLTTYGDGLPLTQPPHQPLQKTSQKASYKASERAPDSAPQLPAVAMGDANPEAPMKQTEEATNGDSSNDASQHKPGRLPSAARKIIILDSESSKLKERDVLLADIATLEADLALVEAENYRIQRATEDDNRGCGVLPPNPSVIYSFLCRRSLPDISAGRNFETPTEHRNGAAAVTAAWVQAATNPIAFLPFGKPRADILPLLQLGRTAESDASYGQAAADDNIVEALSTTSLSLSPLVSHYPLAMTTAEELPFLQAFTPLIFRSQLVIAPPLSQHQDAPSDAALMLLQKHIITATSAAPPGMFMARIEMTVHSRSLRIEDLSLLAIEPAAARAELQPMLDLLIVPSSSSENREGGSALTRNVTVLTWALGEWVRLAVRRAKFWVMLVRLQTNKGITLLERIKGREATRVARAIRRTGQRRDNRAGGRRADDDVHDNSHGVDNANEAYDNDGNYHEDDKDSGVLLLPTSPAALLEHIGRTAMDINVPSLSSMLAAGNYSHPVQEASSALSTSLRVEWTIHFDWTGEARSKIGIIVRVPPKWRRADKRGRLAELPRLFDQLVKDNGDPLHAVETVMALLAGDADVM